MGAPISMTRKPELKIVHSADQQPFGGETSPPSNDAASQGVDMVNDMPGDQSDQCQIIRITLDERSVKRRSPEVEQERAVAIYDLIEENQFRPLMLGHEHHTGQIHLQLAIQENRLIFGLFNVDDELLTQIHLSLTPFRKIVRDYFTICDSYYNAIKVASPSQIEAIDMGRRGVHNEGSEMLTERLNGKVEMNFDTARRLFTLVCVLHIK